MADISVVRAYAEVSAVRESVSSAVQLLGWAAEAPQGVEAALKSVGRSLDAILRDIGEFINTQNAPAAGRVAGSGPQ
ncbi:hypothetical protein [Mycobacteroides chelonae]|nr:hypothetical protein [Mycobacteroides chelonae]